MPKSRRKNAGGGKVSGFTTGNRVRAGVTVERRYDRGAPHAPVDRYGLLRASKYRALGDRCRENVGIAEREGFTYTPGGRTFGTTEEQVVYGELRRRGFAPGLGSAPKSFATQSYIAGHNVDFEVWIGGERFALRPQNRFWHGNQDKVNRDDLIGDDIVAAGYTLCDIWSDDALSDSGIERKLDQFFGRP